MANRWYDQYNTTAIKSLVTVFCTFKVTDGSGTPQLQSWNPPSMAASGAGSYSAATTGPSSMPGAPNRYQYGSSGIYSITRNSTGKYTIALQDSFTRLVGANAMVVTPNATAAAPAMAVLNTTNVTSGTAPTVVVQFQASGGSATELAQNEVVTIELQLQNSAAFG